MNFFAYMIVVMTVFLEARNQPKKGQIAVIRVILNRACEQGVSPARICLMKNQFDGWKHTEQFSRIQDDPVERDALSKICHLVLTTDRDESFRATFFCNAEQVPPWFMGAIDNDKIRFVERIGDHNFYERV